MRSTSSKWRRRLWILPTMALLVLSCCCQAQPYQHSGKTQWQILEHWAPRVYQDTRNDDPNDYKFYEQQDMITRFDFDGDWDARNNWEHNCGHDAGFNGGKPYNPPAYAYASFAETSTHYFLSYYYFHPTDDAEIGPLAEEGWVPDADDGPNMIFLLGSSSDALEDMGVPLDKAREGDRHENDVEAVYIMVQKSLIDPNSFGFFKAMLTEAHGDLLPYLYNQVSFTGSHPHIYITSNGMSQITLGPISLNEDHGHGIYAYNNARGGDFPGDDGIIYNVSSTTADTPGRTSPYEDGTYPEYWYRLLPLDEFWNRRMDTSHFPFAGYGDFGGQGDDGKGKGAHMPWDKLRVADPQAEFRNHSELASVASYASNYLYNPHMCTPEESQDRTQRSYFTLAAPEGWGGKWEDNGDKDTPPLTSTNIKKTSEVIFLGNNSSYGQIYPHKGTVIVQGTGSDIQGAEDSFNFAWRQLTGNFEIVAKLVSLQGNIDPWAKAGLMMRETLNSSSKNIFFGMASKNMDVYQRRNSNSGQTTVSPRFNYSEFDNKPIWLKMKRVDNTIYTEFSSDGVTWRAYRSEAVAMDCNVFVGLAVTAHNTKWKCTAAFDEVKVTDLQDAVACVCSSNGVSNQSLWIEKFQIGTSNGTQYGYLFNQTGKNYGYGDYYSFNLAYRKELQTQPGLTYPFTITAGSAPNMLNTKYYAITIDFNGDGDFDDPGEQVHRGGATGFITIPSWVKTAPMRMRVSVKFDSPADACERDFQGEVEDYGLSIVNPRNYCTPAVSNPTFFFKKIAVNNLERFPVYPASSSYTLVTQPTITACAGGSLNVSIQPGENMVTNGFTYVVTGFIDYNFDGDFADAGERIFEKVAYTSAGEPDHMYVNVAIPSNLSVSTRMRVSIIPKSSNYTADPCGGTRTTEDYVINIINDSPAVYSISAASICQGQNLMVNLSDTDAGTTYRVLVNNVGTNAILAGTGNATSISLSHEYFNNGDSISVEATKASGSKKMMSPNYIQAVVNGVSQIYDVLDQNPLQVAPNTSAIVRLNASETGANYFALVNGVVNGNAVAGTGNALTFTIPSASFSEGDIISVAAMKGVCNTLMNNSVAVSIVPCLGGGSTTESWIESITFNGRQITTGNNDGHADFTNNHLLTSYGLTGSITITPGFTASAVARYYKVWIDFNQDGDFNDVSELVASSTATASAYTKSFTIPAGAKPGITKLRISQRADSSSDPCYVQGQGEVEDYHVFIEPYCLPPGTGATTYIEHMKVGELTNVSGLDHGYGSYLYLSTTLKTGKNIPYKIVSSSTAPNQYYYIYIDLNADGFFTSTERLVSVTGSGSVEGNLVIPEGTLPTLTRMRIVNSKATIPDSSCGAAFDGETEDYTVEIQDYCDAGVSVAAYLFVNRFRFAGQIDNTSQWSDQAWSGSTDYSQLIAQATPGSTYSFTITPGYTNPSYKPNFSIKIWVDYNRDGIFDDATEKAFFKENNTAEVTASLSIPASAVAGKARMRVMLFRSGEVTSSPEPCFEAWTRYSDDPSVWVFGEVEDYSIQINQSGSGRVATVNTYTDPETHEHAEAIVGGIQFYPNPATGDHGTLKVEVEMLQDIRISLMDLTGKVYNSVLHPQVSGLFSAEVGLNGLPEGVYIVKVDGSTFTKGIKLIRK